MAESENFAHYQVSKRADGSLWELGRGAMGVTYKAFDTNLRCHVALKVINAAFLDSEMARQRFLREARTAAGLSHPNVASVFHLGESGGNYFYSMEFIDGETIEAFVRRKGPLPPLLALRIALQVARALRAASREGLVHRDIKPANVMLLHEEDEDELHVKVIDFGLAKAHRKEGDQSATITVAGFVGTPHFASPEQLEEKDLDVRSDMYSLGISLWYMLLGKPPFAGSLGQVMSQHLTRRPPFEQLAAIPPEVVHLLEHVLEKDAAKRPQTASDLRREIEQAIHALERAQAVAGATGAGPAGAYFPTLASVDDPGTAVSRTAQVTTGLPVSGVILGNRYRLLHEADGSEDRSLFEAVELDSGRTVAVRVMGPEALPLPERFQQVEEEVARARLAPHPSLLGLYAFERSGPQVFLAFEWVSGFPVLDLLRHRHALTASEMMRLIEPLAAAIDHARSQGLPELDLRPARILLAFEPAIDRPARTALLDHPLAEWPPFRPKILPLDFRTEAAVLPTWAGQQTIVPAAAAPAAGLVRPLALLAYELLGGNPTVAGTSAAVTTPRAPIAALSEDGNSVLRRALQAGTNAAPFGSATEFAAALGQIVGLRSGQRNLPSAPAVAALASSPSRVSSVPEVAPLSASVPHALPLNAWSRKQGQPADSGPGGPAQGGSRGPIVTIAALLVICCLLGVACAIGAGAWYLFGPLLRPQAKTAPPVEVRAALPVNSAGQTAAQPTSTATSASPGLPPIAPAVPFHAGGQAPQTATASPAAANNTNSANPSPPPDRSARFKELLQNAQDLEHSGNVAGALNAYVNLAQDYPEQDQGLSRVDSFVSSVRGAPLAPEAEQKRAQLLRSPMENAARLGSGMAMLYLGDRLLSAEPESAADWYKQAAGKEVPEAMYRLGNLYYKGVGVPARPEEAAHWFELASNKGYVRAKIYLAECYRTGIGGVGKDPAKAFQLLNEALGLDQNNALAMEELALDYERGIGTTQDFRRAFVLTKRAAELGRDNALANLGAYYMNGTGVHKDPRLGVAAFKEGADKGSAECMFFYAQCLYNGVSGVNQDRGAAIGYYQSAAAGGSPRAQDWCRQNRVSFTATAPDGGTAAAAKR